MRAFSRHADAAFGYAAPRPLHVGGAAAPRGRWWVLDATWLEVTASTRLVLLLALLAVVAYLNALPAGFTFDDHPHILGNPVVTHGVDLVRILATPLPPGDLYRPATILTFALNEAVSPGAAAPFHAVNILLHALATILVFWLTVQLFDSARVAAIAAVLFAVHPIHTEAVTSVVGRAELMGAAFGLLAIVTAAPDGVPLGRLQRLPRVALRSVSLLAFSIAVLSKESALTVLPLLLLYRVARRDQPMVAGLWRELCSSSWIPYALCAALYLAIRDYVVFAIDPPAPVSPLNNMLAIVPWTVRVPSALGVLWDYFGLLNVPLVLSADYSYAQVPVVTSWLNLRTLGGLGLIVAAAVVAIRNRRAAVRFAAAFPFVALMVTSNLVFPIGTIKAERLLYFPSVGWALLAAWGFERLLRRPAYRALGVGLLLAVVAAFGARTWSRNWDWHDDATLYSSMVRSAPDSAKSRYNFGVILQGRHADEFAVPQFRRALAIYPYWAEIALGIGIAYERSGRTDEAVEWYAKSLATEPWFWKAHTNMCHVLHRHGRFAEAADACREGLRHNPVDANLLKGLGASLVGLGEVHKGVAVLRRSLMEDGGDIALRKYVEQMEQAQAEDEQEVMQ